MVRGTSIDSPFPPTASVTRPWLELPAGTQNRAVPTCSPTATVSSRKLPSAAFRSRFRRHWAAVRGFASTASTKDEPNPAAWEE